MSSNIRLKRICQHCGNEFVAKTTVTQYCGDTCAKRAYKVRLRTSKVEASNKETKETILKPIEELNAKEFLSIADTCQLLGLSRWTVWRAIKAQELPSVKIGRRCIIKRSHLDQMLEQSKPTQPTKEAPQDALNLGECYTISEIQRNYNISEKALYEIIKRNSIPKVKEGIYTYVPKKQIDNILGSMISQKAL
ncbi:helix-turn-helix domain-containing protein [Sabulibacter ruber]|uniref:helix-turn-helix domain-containing protein n=1 Tax=Sabulibacter ruber TaxID=2811901 RepID=UPI001A963D54|nr:helix-turn-helix domain-containing protein [Sabulibacter ruber]